MSRLSWTGLIHVQGTWSVVCCFRTDILPKPNGHPLSYSFCSEDGVKMSVRRCSRVCPLLWLKVSLASLHLWTKNRYLNVNPTCGYLSYFSEACDHLERGCIRLLDWDGWSASESELGHELRCSYRSDTDQKVWMQEYVGFEFLQSNKQTNKSLKATEQ